MSQFWKVRVPGSASHKASVRMLARAVITGFSSLWLHWESAPAIGWTEAWPLSSLPGEPPAASAQDMAAGPSTWAGESPTTPESRAFLS